MGSSIQRVRPVHQIGHGTLGVAAPLLALAFGRLIEDVLLPPMRPHQHRPARKSQRRFALPAISRGRSHDQMARHCRALDQSTGLRTSSYGFPQSSPGPVFLG